MGYSPETSITITNVLQSIDIFQHIRKRFIRTSKSKIYKYMTAVLQNVYINKLSQLVHKWNNTIHRSIKIKLADVKPYPSIEFDNKINTKG